MPISALLLPLNCTENRASIPVTENGETTHEKNNRDRVKIDLPPLNQPVKTLLLYSGFTGDSSF